VTLLAALLLFSARSDAGAAEGSPAPARAGGEAGLPAAGARDAARPKREVRAIWVTRWDYRTEEDVRKILERCAGLGFNRVIFQVRGQADAYYRSTLEPWGEGLEARDPDGDPGFDPLEIALEEARKRGLELHAWFNVLPGWKGSAPPRSKRHLVHAHPDWFLRDQAGRRRILGDQGYAMLNPCLGPVRDHLAAVAGELAARYPLAGFQIDYVRFLDRDPSKGEDVPYDPPTLEAFRKDAGGTPQSNPAAWNQFRKQAVDRVVERIASAVRLRRPGCVISLAAIRDREHARSHLFQDAEGWVNRGWVDQVYPMIYERESDRFTALARGWTGDFGGGKVVLGIGVHLLEKTPDVGEQIRLVRTTVAAGRAAGYCLFSYGEFFPAPPKPPPSPPEPQQKSSPRPQAAKAPPSPKPEKPTAAEKAQDRLQAQRRALISALQKN